MSNGGGGSSAGGGGIGFAGLLTIAFIVLKLTGYIAWSWWWVLSPLWIGALLAIVVLAVGFGIVLAVGAVQDKNRRKARERRGHPRPYEHGPRHRWGRREAP